MFPWLIFSLWFATNPTGAQQLGGGGGAPIVAAINHLGAGRNEQAAALANQLLQHRSTALLGSGLKGIALARMGRQSDALPWLRVSSGLSIVENQGGRKAYADALRSVGEGRQAWQVRSSLAAPGVGPMRRLRAMLDGIEDLLSEEATIDAIDLGSLAIALAPGSAAAHAHYAAALLAADEREEAEFHQWLSARLTAMNLPQQLLNEARIAMAYGDVVGAEVAWERARELRPNSATVAAGHAAWLRSQGNIDDSWATLNRDPFRRMQDESIVEQRIRTLLSMDPNQAREEAERFERLFPTQEMGF